MAASSPGFVTDGEQTLDEHLHFGAKQNALLALLLLGVLLIAVVGYRSDRQVASDTAALNDHLQAVSGNAVTLQREVLTHALVTSRWADGHASNDQLDVSNAFVQRQLSIFDDEAGKDPELRRLAGELQDDLDSLLELQADGRPEPGSERDVQLQAIIDDMNLSARRFFDVTEQQNFELVHALEDRLGSSQRTRLLVALLLAGLIGALFWSLRRISRANYDLAIVSLRLEQLGHAEARAHKERAERRLAQAQKLESVGQLAAGIAHEINTPMQYIGDNTHFLKTALGRLLDVAGLAAAATGDGAGDDDLDRLRSAVEKSKLPMLRQRAPKAADDALAGVENVSRIVTAMKRFSHPGSEEFEPMDLNQSIATTMTVCRNEWKYAADIQTELADELPLIDGRLGSLNQVWLNVIVNAAHAVARRHGDQQGLITIRTGTVDDGNSVEVVIADNGTGIKAENLNRIFDQFFTTKEVGRGTGQGLAVCHQIITQEHHGTIEVESTVMEGTTMTVTLPVKQPTREDRKT